jgi:AraC-like DNA-binding protein
MNTIRRYLPATRLRRSSFPFGPLSSLSVFWLLFTASVTAFVTNFFFGAHLPQLSVILSVMSFVTCGLAWLLTRALFRREHTPALWPQFVVATLFAVSLILYFTESDASRGVLGYAANVQSLIGSTVLLMTFLEPFDGLNSSPSERKFRLSFAGGYIAILAVAFAVRLPEFSPWQAQTQIGLAVTALVAVSFAVQYRMRHPLEKPAPTKAPRSPAQATHNPALAQRLRTLLEDEQVFLDPQIKVASLSQRLRTPEYKITQCLVSDLGFRNFNQMVNAYRIMEAKRRLASTQYDDCAILIIAMDCGFASIGPFNRAFKTQTGMTPSAYRQKAQLAA